MALLSPSTRFRWLCFGTLVDWKLSLKCITGPPSLWGEFGQGFTRQGGGIWQPKFSEGKKRSDIKITHGYSLSTTSWKTTLSSITGCNIFKKKKEPSNNKRRKFIVEHAWTTRSNGMQERTRGKIRTREWLTTDSKRHFFFFYMVTFKWAQRWGTERVMTRKPATSSAILRDFGAKSRLLNGTRKRRGRFFFFGRRRAPTSKATR